MDGLLIIYIVTGVVALLVGGWIKYNDWKTVHKHSHR